MTTTSADLLAALPGSTLVIDPDVLDSLSHDDAEWAPVGRPAAALRARSTAEVQAAVRACADARIPVVTRGAGTGLSGGANAVDGCLVLDVSRMDRVLEIDTEDMVAVANRASSTTISRPRWPSTGSGTHRTRRARRGRPSAATWPPTPAACAA